MSSDPVLAGIHRTRVAYDYGVGILLDAWSSAPVDRRAAMIAAQGDVQRASAYGSDGWKRLAEGDVLGALRIARDERVRSAPMEFLEAEALIAAGAIVAGLDRLQALHHKGDPAASLALARRRHLLGDYTGAERAAMALPMHAQAALIGSRAALANNRVPAALRFIEPFLEGVAPLPEPAVAGAMAVVVASIMARSGQVTRLQRFTRCLIDAVDLPDDMMPAAARAGWIGGIAEEAWNRFGTLENPWMAAARLELAILAGNGALASQLSERAGSLGAPSTAATFLLRGGPVNNPPGKEGERLFGEGIIVHIWRTHPHRWQPWIDAALRTPATVAVYDLAGNKKPEAEAIPQIVLDDGSLIELLSPVACPVRSSEGSGVWVGQPLCRGIGIGHDWPEKETRAIREGVPLAASRESAAVLVLGVDQALACAHEGRRVVVIAPPGDPFWAGPLPERAWPALSIVRVDPRIGWSGAGARAAQTAQVLLESEND